MDTESVIPLAVPSEFRTRRNSAISKARHRRDLENLFGQPLTHPLALPLTLEPAQ